MAYLIPFRAGAINNQFFYIIVLSIFIPHHILLTMALFFCEVPWTLSSEGHFAIRCFFLVICLFSLVARILNRQHFKIFRLVDCFYLFWRVINACVVVAMCYSLALIHNPKKSWKPLEQIVCYCLVFEVMINIYWTFESYWVFRSEDPQILDIPTNEALVT